MKSGVRIAPLARMDHGLNEADDCCYEEEDEEMQMKEMRIVRGEHRKSSYDRVIREYIESFALRREERQQRHNHVQVQESYN